MNTTVVRLSRGTFEPSLFADVTSRLKVSASSLTPAIRKLRGCLHFWAGTDEGSNSMVNISVWSTLEDARQLDSLPAMLALAKEFSAVGVKFERPVVNYGVLWEI